MTPIAACTGYPAQRETVRPCAMCQACLRWQSDGKPIQPPAVEKNGIVVCDQRIARG